MPSQVFQGSHNATAESVTLTIEAVKLAKAYSVKTVSYEGGPGYSVEGPGTQGLDNMITAARDARMEDVVKSHVETCWQFGWDEYQYFEGSARGADGYGCWGATEDWKDLTPGPPKLRALYKLTGRGSPGL